MTRRRRSLALVALAILLAYAVGDAAAERWLSARLERAIQENGSVEGGMDEVDVCLACAAYRIERLDLDPSADDGADGLLDAREIQVEIVPDSLWSARLLGGIRLRGAELELSVGRVEAESGSAMDVSWREIGAALLPVPFDRLDVEDGVLVVRHTGYEEPIVWRFEDVDVSGTHLSRDSPSPASIRASARAPGGGGIELRVDFSDDEAFTLRGEIRDVPLSALSAYIGQVLGLDVESGILAMELDVEGAREGWSGSAECLLRDLDVFDVDDLRAGPVRALSDAMAGSVLGAATLGGDGPLRVRLALGQDLGRPEVDSWLVLARLLRRALLAPFVRPLETLRSATLDVVVGGDDD